jgi:hypothetical protein
MDVSAEKCVTCGRPMAGRYCSDCGEQAPHAHSYSLRHFVEEALENLIHLDGRVVRSFRALLLAPGDLPSDFLRGRRKPYMGPVHMFLVANLIYFILQPFSGFVPFTTTMNIQTSEFQWSGLATRMVSARLESRSIAREEYRRRFDETAHLQGKTLVIIMVPLFALAAWALYRRARPFFVEHLVFSFYAYAFLLIWTGVTTVIETRLIGFSVHHGYRPGGSLIEVGSSAVTVVPFAVYIYLASRRVYGERVGPTLLKTALLTGWLMASIMTYRMILFFTTFYAT